MIDLLSTIPFDIVFSFFIQSDDGRSSINLQSMSMLKIIRVLRLNRLINFINTSQDMKLSLRLLQSIFLILLYIHISACVWYFNVNQNKLW